MRLSTSLSCLTLVAALATQSGCAQFPELDAARTPGIEYAPFPAILPLDALVRGAEPRATPEMRAGIEGRVSGLRARAEALQGPVVPASDRARMDDGVTLTE
jgi:hypothetical protein